MGKAIVLTIALATSISPALSNTPRACLDWINDPKGPLPRMDIDNVIYRSLLFKRDGRNYDVETFSDMSPVGGENCFRWEVVNSTKPRDGQSPDQIIVDHLTWPAAGIRVTRMRAGDNYREFNRRRERIDSKRDNNLVHAFESERTATLSWLATAPQSNTQSVLEPLYRILRTKEILPAFERVEPSIREAAVTVIAFGNGRQAPPEISQAVGFGGLLINITSLVAPEGNSLLVATNAQVKYLAAMDTPRINFPVLTATQEVGPKVVGNPDDAERFLSLFREKLRSPGPSQADYSFRFPVASGPGGEFRIFRTRQPVIVSVGDERHCYLIAAYTPIPVGFTLEHCW